MLKIAVIEGSSRQYGNTAGLVSLFEKLVLQRLSHCKVNRFDLNQYTIRPFSYDGVYDDDLNNYLFNCLITTC